MDMKIEATVEDVVTQMVGDGFMFTAFDVTKKVREVLGRDTFVSHSDINRWVQDKFLNGDFNQYVRDIGTVSVNGVDSNPWIYHDPNSGINLYDPLWMKDNPTQTGMKGNTTVPSNVYIPTVFSAGGTISVADGVARVKVTSKRRLNVPLKTVEDCGFMPNQDISVYVDSYTIKIRHTVPHDMGHLMNVNADGRIRISNSMLKKISASNVDEFKVRSENNEILIEAV